MISREDRRKKELAGIIKALADSVKRAAGSPHEPEPGAAMANLKDLGAALGRTRAFLTNPENWSGGLTLVDLGELVDEELSCSCFELEPKFAEGHHHDCDRWYPQEDADED